MWSDKCLGTLHFLPAAPAIAMAAALVTFALDFVASYIAERRFSTHTPTSASIPPTAASSDLGKAESGQTDGRGHEHGGCCPDPEAAITAWQNKQAWQVLLLEAGIIFHSFVPLQTMLTAAS